MRGRKHWNLRLTIDDILAWADDHKARFGDWPLPSDGKVYAAPLVAGPAITWCVVDIALTRGHHGLPGGSSLAKLLLQRRGRRHLKLRPNLTLEQILAWADAHYQRTGQWPKCRSGPIVDVRDETWFAVERKLNDGGRGLVGGSSIAQVLETHRGVRNPAASHPLTIRQILRWADAHHRRTGRWPLRKSGPIPESPGDTWAAIDAALVQGVRGLTADSSLARLLAKERDVRNIKDLPNLTVKQIVRWARAYHRRTGRWPSRDSGPIPESNGETWGGIVNALYLGRRGLPARSTLPRLLQGHGQDTH